MVDRDQSIGVPTGSATIAGYPRRQRVVHVITEAHPMGGAQLNTMLSLQAQQQRYHVELVVGGDGDLCRRCRDRNIAVTVIPLANRLFDPLGDVRALVRLVRHFKSTMPDIVHTHTSKAGILGRLAARLARVPATVHTVHASSYGNRGVLVGSALKLLDRACCRMTDEVIVVADAMGAELVAEKICPSEKITTVMSGIDFSGFPVDARAARLRVRREFEIPGSTPVIVAVGHLSPRKGFDILLDAAKILSRNAHNFAILIVGEGKLQAHLQSRVEREGLTPTVRLIGAREDVPDILASADVFVQTSWHEGLSRSLLEAVYSGLPAVATDVNATAEAIEDGVSGYLVAPGDVNSLAARLHELLDDPELRLQMSEHARKDVAGRRTVASMSEALDVIYTRALETRELVDQEVAVAASTLRSVALPAGSDTVRGMN